MSREVQEKVFVEDRLALEWQALEKRRKELIAEISKYLREFGSRPAKRPGKLAAMGAEFELALIDALRRSIRSAKALAKFRAKCPRRFVKRAIARRIVFAPIAGAEKYLMQHAPTKVLRMYQAAVRVKKSKPRLVVRKLTARKKAA